MHKTRKQLSTIPTGPTLALAPDYTGANAAAGLRGEGVAALADALDHLSLVLGNLVAMEHTRLDNPTQEKIGISS